MQNLPYCEWGEREYLALLAGFVKPPSRRTVSALREAFEAILSPRPIFPVNLARTGLRLVLEAFRAARPEADQVIIPAYVCPSVVETVEACGLQPRPVDIGTDLNMTAAAVEQAVDGSTLAVIAVHMYGCPAPIAEIETLCRERGIFLIDDAAQVLGVSVNGHPLGTFGDAGIFSFGQSKTIVAGSRNAGGVLALNDARFADSIAADWQALRCARTYRSDVLHFLWRYKCGSLAEQLRYLVRKRWRRNRPGNWEPLATAEKMNSFVAALALEQLQSLPQRIAGRQRVAETYHQALRQRQDIAFPQYAPGRYLTRVVLKLPAGLSARTVRSHLRRLGVRTRMGYPAFAADQAPPLHALEVQPRLIEVPSHSKMTEKSIAAICAAMDQALRLRAEPGPAPAEFAFTRPSSRNSEAADA